MTKSDQSQNKEIFDAVCKEFNDNFFEDKWDDLPKGSLSRHGIEKAMYKALLKLAQLTNRGTL